ncbi:MAG: VanW family protein [Lewinellaceae bacterium]|nr:VanW family protein [Lewinellaceae bacterium]
MKIWKEIKRFVRQRLRVFQDWRSGESGLFARSKIASDELANWLSHPLAQPIRPGATFVNKLANLRLATTSIDGLLLRPGAVFSFWEIVGPPSERRGFRASRNIVRGQLSAEVGGGLCQISGIIYQLSLMAGLEIHERHPHSVDIYTEEERFSPLGADATVVFGYKDLRVANPFDFPIVFRFEISEAEVVFSLFSTQKIPLKNIEFRRQRLDMLEKVETTELTTHNGPKVLAVSWYETMKR